MLGRYRRYRKRIRPLPVKSASGNLETLRLFLNPPKADSSDESMETPEALTRFLAGHGLIPEAAELTEDEARKGLEIRHALLALVRRNSDAAERMEAVFRDLRYRVVFEGGPRFRPVGEGVERAFGELLTLYVRAWQTGRWKRLKACQECGQIFYDFSKNRSAKWCNDLCGERVRRATARRRRRRRSR